MDHSRLTDHDLMKACARGEMAAFTEIVHRYKDRITNYLYRYTGDYRAAEDLAQEAFLRVYRKIGEYNASARFSTWLYTIATNLAKDEFKRRARHPASPLEVRAPGAGTSQIVTLAPPDDAAPPDEAAERTEMQSLVLRIIDTLDPGDREVLLLREVQGLSYEEIAGILGTPLGTVKSRISRARLSFKDRFKAEYPE